MLNGISVENYKAFEKGNIKIKPITILLGANSIGKSSLMQLILLIKQTSNFSGEYKSALKLNGEFVNLGEPENVFRNLDTNKPFSFEVNIELNRKFDKSYHLDDIYMGLRKIQREFLYKDAYINYKFENGKKIKTVSKRIYKIHEDLSDENISIIQRTKDTIKEYKLYKKKVAKSKSLLELFDKKTGTDTLIEKIDVKALEHTINFLNRVKELDLNQLNVPS